MKKNRKLWKEDKILEFVSAGIACNAFTLIAKTGILKILQKKGGYFLEQKKGQNRAAIQAALLSLELAKIVSKKGRHYYLTHFGKKLSQRVGLITMLFEGYGDLMSKQVELANGKIPFSFHYLNENSIAISSIQFSEETVEPLLLHWSLKLKPKGTICDLGCGSAAQLLKICKKNKLSGLGIDYHSDAIVLSKTLTQQYPFIKIEQGDISNLRGIWEEVDLLMECFVTHDITPTFKCSKMLASYKKHFPKMRYFMLVDIVTPSNNIPSHMPGFDYVHGLQGIQTRNYDENLQMFKKAGYKIYKEIPVKGLPNTFLWILEPKEESKNA